MQREIAKQMLNKESNNGISVNVRKAYAFLLLFLASAIVLKAQWQKAGGPEGGNITSLISYNGKAIAANRDGNGYFVYNPTSGVWEYQNDSLAKYNIVAFAESNNFLYAATLDSKIFSYDETSGNWNELRRLPNSLALINCLAIKGDNIVVGTTQGIFLSSDKGRTWITLSNELTSAKSISFLNDDIWVGKIDKGLWQFRKTLLGWKGESKEGFASLKINKVYFSNDIFWVCTNKGIYRSLDYGGTINLVTPSWLFSRDIVSLGSMIVAGTMEGVYTSYNNGINWSFTNSNLNSPDVNAICISQNNFFIAIESAGIYSTATTAFYWKLTNRGLTAENVTSINAKGEELFTSANNKIYFSSDGGKGWNVLNFISNGEHILPLERIGEKIFVASPEGVFSKNIGEEDWQAQGKGLSNDYTKTLNKNKNTLYVTSEAGVFLSKDTGRSWTGLGFSQSSEKYTSLATSGENVWVGTEDEGVLFYNKNTNQWIKQNAGLPSKIPLISSLLISNGKVYAGTKGGGLFIYDSVNSQWRKEDVRGITDFSISSMVSIDSNILLGTNKGIYIWQQGRQEWVDGGLESSTKVTYLYVDSNSIYAGTEGNSIFFTTKKELIRPEIKISTLGPICAGDSIELIAEGGGPFIWFRDNNQTDTLGRKKSLKLLLEGSLDLMVVGEYGAVGSKTIAPEILEKCHPIEIVGNSFYCLGDTADLLVRSEGDVWWMVGNDTISNGEELKLTVDKDLILVAVGEFGEKDTLQIAMDSPQKCFPVAILGDTITCPGTNLILKALGDESFWWASASSPFDTISNDSIFSINSSATATYVLNGNKGGQKTFTIYIKEISDCFPIKVYEVVTPNNDGKNEVLFIENINFYNGNEVAIYNKWGSEVFREADYNNTWSGDNLPSGYYFYNVKINQDKVFKGSLLIKR